MGDGEGLERRWKRDLFKRGGVMEEAGVSDLRARN